MSQEHTEGYFLPARILFSVGREFGNDRSDWSIEVKQAALVVKHRHGCGGDDFG